MIGDRLEALVADLTSSRTDRRNVAVGELFAAVESKQEPEALEKLATLVEPLAASKVSWDRALAIHLIGGVRGERALPLLEKYLADPDSEVRSAVEDIAEDLGDAGKPLLKKLVKDEDFGVRFWAAATLSETNDPEGVEVLIEGLKTAGTRFESLQGLRRLQEKRGEAAARKVLGKWFLAPIDRVAALGLLASIGDAESKQRLVEEIGKKRSDARGLAMQIAGEAQARGGGAGAGGDLRRPRGPAARLSGDGVGRDEERQGPLAARDDARGRERVGGPARGRRLGAAPERLGAGARGAAQGAAQGG
ncbi:MAG: hypothetical protein QM765_00520 [Myxococcales bacterium]